MKKYDAIDTIQKEQFNIRLSFKYYLCSAMHLWLLGFCYLVFDTFVFGAGGYLLLNLFFYRFFFGTKKNGEQFSPFLLRHGQKIYKTIREMAKGGRG